ncbi:patatin-like phospholipase family protein [Desulforhopalus sp. 52FAK]
MGARKKVGLVLGSGASRGWAHIGVIRALEEAGVRIDYIAGCSVGAYVGAVYASGNLISLENFIRNMDGKKIFSYFDVVFPRAGLLNGKKRVQELFSMHTDAEDFADLATPLMMVATDLERGKKVVLKSGSILNALRATMSYPGLFEPVRMDGRWLVDGGLVDPVPVGLARVMGADLTIAVDLNSRIVSRSTDCRDRVDLAVPEKIDHSEPLSEGGNMHDLVKKMSDYYENIEKRLLQKTTGLLHRETAAPDIIDTVMTSVGIMQERITRINLAVDQPDILIQPRLGELKMMNFDQVEHTIAEGYIAAREQVEDILPLLQAPKEKSV